MSFSAYFVINLILALLLYLYGRSRAIAFSSSHKLFATKGYFGLHNFLVAFVPSFLFLLTYSLAEPGLIRYLVQSSLTAVLVVEPESFQFIYNELLNVHAGIIPFDASNTTHDLGLAVYVGAINTASNTKMILYGSIVLLATLYSFYRTKPGFNARIHAESMIKWILALFSLIAVITTFGILLSVLFESIRFFGQVSIIDFLFGTQWSPQTAIREDQVGSSGAFGAVPVFSGTLLIAMVAMAVAIPFGLFSAIFLSEYAKSSTKDILKPILEILAGIPTVVYGYFAALVIGPFIRELGGSLGWQLTSESALAVGLVMGVMIIPFVSSISSDVISAVPMSLREGSYGCGATKSETIRNVVLPAALPGIIAGVLLAVSRAIGETMIVVMAAGLAANLTFNPLEPVTTVTAQIVTLLVGDQEFDSAKTLAAFALGLVLFVVTLLLNIYALHVVRKYREQYE